MRNLIAGLGLAMAVLSGCHRTEEKPEELTLMVTQPIQKDTVINNPYVCQIRSVQHIELRSLEKGYLQNVYVDEGQFVYKGQLLFQLKPVVFQAESQKARAELSSAEIEYQNTKKLHDNNIVSKNELALSQAKVAQAKAELSLANAHLGFTKIRAPFSGIVGRFNDVRLGSLLDEGALLTTLSNNSELWVYFNVSEAAYLDFKAHPPTDDNRKVQLLMANNELYSHDGVIQTTEADFNNETGNIAFRASFPNPDGLLRHGETGTILMPSYLHNALLIPQEATFDVLDKKFVYVVDSRGVLQAKPITVSVEMPHIYVVTSGLQPSDKILVEGLQKVKNNDRIKPNLVPFGKIINELDSLHAE